MSGSSGLDGLDLTGGLPSVLTVVRPDDLMVLRFRFRNLRLDIAGAGPQLVKQDAGFSSWAIVTFPPQSTGEESLVLGGPVPVWPGFQSRAALSGPTRLAFRVTPPVPFTLASLLDWRTWELAVAEDQPLPDFAEVPDLPTEGTVIEAPYRLGLSPGSSGSWRHRGVPATRGGRTELWHTEHTGSVRAVWVGPDGLHPEVPVDLPLTQANRKVVAGLSQTLGPLTNHRLLLSSRGAWLDLEGDWRLSSPQPVAGEDDLFEVVDALVDGFPDDFHLSAVGSLDHWVRELVGNRLVWWPVDKQPFVLREMLAAIVEGEDVAGEVKDVVRAWSRELPVLQRPRVQYRHRTTQGRDQYAMLTTPGFLYPWGHRATIVTITERQFRPPPNHLMSAFLVKRQQIIVDQPVVDFTALGAGYRHGGRENPFARVRLLTEATTALDHVPNEHTLVWPRVAQQDVAWSLIAHDSEGRAVSMTMLLLFVPAATAEATPFEERLARTAYGARSVELHGQEVALAPGVPSDEGSAVMVTEQLVLEGRVGDEILATALAPGAARFLPAITRARVRIPAVDQLLAASGAAAATEVVFHQSYLDHGFDRTSNAAQVFLTVQAPAGPPRTRPALRFPAQRAGGLARPDVALEAVSTSLGPVADAANLGAGAFDPGSFLPNAKILGGILLRDLLDRVTESLELAPLPQFAGLDAAETWAKLADPGVDVPVPSFVTSKTLDPTGLPTGVETRYVWKPRLRAQPVDSAKLLRLDPGCAFRLLTVLRSSVGSPTPTLDSQGELSGFRMEFAGLVAVKVRSLAFTAREGNKPDFSASGVDLDFLGELAFVNEIRKYIPADGFSDPPAITVTPEAITAGYSLGLPAIGVGVFSLENIQLSAELVLPFVDKPTRLRFALSSRHDPCLVTVSLFAGGAYFALTVAGDGEVGLEAAIEFGGNFSLELVVASGGVHVLAGVYFELMGPAASLGGYLRAGGAVTVLGIVTISVEFYLILGFTKSGSTKIVWGEATLTVGIEVLFLRQDVSLHVRREFAGSPGDPTFEELVGPQDWAEYCAAFGT